MPIGSKNKDQGGYIFIDGKALTAEEAFRVQLTERDTAPVPGQDEVSTVPGAAEAAGQAGRTRSWSAKRSFRELDSSPAFELSEDAGAALRPSLLQTEDKRATRRTALILCAVLAAVLLFSLCISVSWPGTLYSPVTVVQALGTRLYLAVGQLFNLSYWSVLAPNEAAQAIPGYADIGQRFDVTMVTLLCGILLALSGMMYQNVFKNPIAAPTMLGVSAGVRIGTILLVIAYGSAAVYMDGLRYVYCYIGGVLIIALVMAFSKFLAKGRSINVVDMLIVGSVLSQLLATVSTYFLTYVMDDEMYEVFYEITSGARTDTEWYAFLFLGVIFVIAVLPVVLGRFRMNVMAFDDGDVRIMGVDPEKLRVVVLILGTLMILAAQIHVGVISMVSLVVPFLVRYLVGSEFGKQLLGNVILGPLMLLVCRDICGLIPFVGAGLSLEMVVGFVALPAYIWMMALGHRGWE